jgi:hypothetical protein
MRVLAVQFLSKLVTHCHGVFGPFWPPAGTAWCALRRVGTSVSAGDRDLDTRCAARVAGLGCGQR